ncbi:MAG: hypothetical protein ACOCT0_01365 [Halobacteriota archaeon]
MEDRDLIEALLGHARENDAFDAVVVDVPPGVLERNDALYSDGSGTEPRCTSTLVAGPVERESDEVVVLDSPSRVGRRDDFAPEIRRKLRADGVYGYRDGYLDGVELPKHEVEVHRARETE